MTEPISKFPQWQRGTLAAWSMTAMGSKFLTAAVGVELLAKFIRNSSPSDIAPA
jgi:hypothetical protein